MCPATDKVLRECIPKYFKPEVLAVVSGGIPETTKLMEVRIERHLKREEGKRQE